MREAMFTRSVARSSPSLARANAHRLTTRPIPVKDSVLPVKVPAGEKAHPMHMTLSEPTQ